MYRVIYDAINDVSDAMKGMLAPKVREVALGEAQVRQVYKISSVGTVAGCRVTDGKITRGSADRPSLGGALDIRFDDDGSSSARIPSPA